MTTPEEPQPLGYGPPPGWGPPAWGPPPQGWPPPQGGYGYQPGWPPWSAPPGPRTNGLAIASLCCGVSGFIYGVPAVLAIIFGFVARSQIKQTREDGGGLALAGIILGFCWIALFLVIVALVVSLGASDGASEGGTL